MSYSLGDIQGFFRRQGPILYLLLAHIPMVFLFALESVSNPLYSMTPVAIAALLWLSVRHCANRPQNWRPLPVLMVMLDVFCVVLGVWRGSAWLVTFGGSLLTGGWILASNRNIPGRMVFAVFMLLALIVRFPPSLDNRLQNRFQQGVSKLSSDLLNATGVIHFTDSAGLHVPGKILDTRSLQGGIASVWLLVVLAVVFSATERRSGPHLVCLVLFSLLLGIILAAASITLGAMLAVGSGTDVSGSVAGIAWRLAVLGLGVASIWSADKAVLLFTGGIPAMDGLITGRKLPRQYDEDDDEEEDQGSRPLNPLTEWFNAWVAPTPLLAKATVAAEHTVMASSAAVRPMDSSSAGAITGDSVVPVLSSHEQEVSGNSESNTRNSPPAVRVLVVMTSLLMFAAQLIRLLWIGG